MSIKNTKKVTSRTIRFRRFTVTFDYSPFFKTIEKKGLTKYILDKEFGISKKQYKRLENGDIINISTLFAIMAAIQVKDIRKIIRFEINYLD